MHQKLSKIRLVAFASPETAMAAFLMPLVVFIPPFYAGHMGLGLATVGLIFGLTKFWDVLTDALVGVASDRLRTPFGRRRPMFAIAVPLLMFCTWRVFVPPADAGAGYFAVWMVLLYIAWTLMTLSHIAWAVELSPDYHERSRIAGYKQAAGLIGMLVATFIPVLIDQLAEPAENDRLAALSWFIIVILPVTATAALLAAKEPDIEDLQSSPTERLGLRDLLGAMRGNRPLRLLLSANVLISMAAAATSGTALFLVERVLELGRFATMAMVPLMFSGLLFLPGWITLSHRIGKHRTFRVAMLYLVAVFPALVLLPPGNLWLCLLAFVVVGAYNGIVTFLPQTMMADITDIEAAKSGDKRTGLYVALLQTSSKLSAALGIALTYLLLELIGFDPKPGAVNTDGVLLGLKILFALLPVGFFFLAWLTMRSYPLDERQQLALRKKIDESKHGAGQQEADAPAAPQGTP